MPDAGRTAHAPRVATAVRPAVAALLLPLLAAAFLAALWLLGGSPAHALDLNGGVDGSEAGTLDPGPGTGPAGDTAPDTDPADGTTEDRTTGTSLDTLVTGEVTAPVTDTLGSVHQHLGDPASGTDGGELSEAGLPVAEVGEGARRVVEGLGREDNTGPGSGLTSVITGEDTPASGTTSEDHAETAERDRGTGADRDTERDRRASGDTAPEGPGTAPGTTADTTPVFDDTTDRGADAAPRPARAPTRGTGPLPPGLRADHLRSERRPGRACRRRVPALPSSVTGPASAAISPWSTTPSGVPAGPADAPTVSPD